MYCHRGGHFVDLDFNCEGEEINGEWVCWDHLTNGELNQIEREELSRVGPGMRENNAKLNNI
jgi:hypothetical protein